MIKLVDGGLIGDFLAYCADKPFGVRMAAALQSYGVDCRFADFWLVYEDDNVVGAVSKLDGDMTLCADKVCDELSAFVGAIGFDTLIAEKSIIHQLYPDSPSAEGAIMQYMGGVTSDNSVIIDTVPSIMEACKILTQCEGESIKTGEFDRFYTDLSLRVRRNTAVCYAFEKSGVAVASAVTDGGAIIGGVAVKGSERKNGIGSALVARLVSDLPRNKKIYLLRLRNENESFYKKLGFENIGSWASISKGCE